MLKQFNSDNILKKSRLPRHEIEFTLSHILKKSRSEIFLTNPRLTLPQLIKAKNIERRRLNGAPLQYLLGETEFFGLRFKVNKHTFIPRPETEILVEAVIARFKKSQGKLKILDLCTGSGAIAVSLAKIIKSCEVVASDIREKTLALAKENAALNQVDSKISFLQSDLFSAIKGNFDIITVNPPYVGLEEYRGLSREIFHEPRIALVAGEKGLDFYLKIFKSAGDFLAKGGKMFLEIGANQARQIIDELNKNNGLALEAVIKDYNQFDRVLIIRKA